ncbi:MAG: hypothetical protein WBE58_24200 [Verrucomicrobiales bacterium]
MRNLLTNIWARDWARRLTWTALTLVTFCMLLGTWMDHRWARQWQAIKQRLVDSGETTDFRRITTEPLPDAENFCAIPLLKDISLDTREAEAKRQTIERYFLPKEHGKLPRPDLASGATLGTPVDLETWGLFLQEAAAEQTALPGGRGAEAVMAWAKSGGSFFDELAAGLDRPSAQWTPPWKTRELPAVLLSATMPHYQTDMALAKTLRLRTSAAASLGEGGLALDSLRIGLRLSEASFDDPFLISLLVGLSQMNGVVNGIWDCAAAQSLDADQWRLLSRELRRIDLEAGLLRAFRGEMAAACNAVDYIKGTGDFELTGGGRPVRRMGVPGGLLDANAATICRLWLEYGIEPLKAGGLAALVAAKPGLDAEIEAIEGNPYVHAESFLASLMFPAVQKVTLQAVHARSLLDLAITVCELERFHAEHGGYPDNLEALGSADPLPLDLLSAAPIQYQKLPEGRYRLWCVGLDGKDNGGIRNLDKKNPAKTRFHDPDHTGDWVWDYPSSSGQ